MKWGNLSMMPSIETPNLPSKIIIIIIIIIIIKN